MCTVLFSLRGRRSKGKGKGIRAQDHARPTRSRAPKFPLALPLPLLTPATQARSSSKEESPSGLILVSSYLL